MAQMYGYRSDERSNGMGTVVSAAAVGFAAGMAANMARKMIAQAPAAAQGDWVKALTAEHRIIEGIFEQILRTSDTDTVKRTMLLKALKGGLAKHAHEEETVVYPALRLRGREQEAREFVEDHADVKTFLYELDMMAKDSPQWLDRVREFHDAVRTHMREEEEEIFPAFRSQLSEQENAKLTAMTQMEALKLA